MTPWTRAQQLYREYPHTFWMLLLATFIDRLGGAVLFPFFALFITARFDVGMTEAGIFFTVFAIAGIVGGVLGGALTDRFGRRTLVIVGLVASALASLGIGFSQNLTMLFIFDVLAGIFGRLGRPAREAMVADLLPPQKQADGFGLLRIVGNVSIALGPAIGGLVASRSYVALFVIDAVASIITAIFVFLLLDETRPQPQDGQEEETLLQTVRGYGITLRDGSFVAFVLIMILLTMGYTQIFTTLSVYLRDMHGVPEQQYSLLITINATMVVLFQFLVTRRTRSYPPLPLMASGAVLYAVGLLLFGVGAAYSVFVLAIVVATVGEMLAQPTGQAVVGRMAPAAMRGRYMAIYGFTWPVAQGVGPLGAGLIMDNLDPRLVWFIGAALALVAALGFLLLRRRVREQGRFEGEGRHGELPSRAI